LKRGVLFKLYDSQTDQPVANITNRAVIMKPPPCLRTNIEAIVPCNISTNPLTMELYSNVTTLTGTRVHIIHRRVERVPRYFLFGNSGNDASDGLIYPGT
jgi:hypothetical protein